MIFKHLYCSRHSRDSCDASSFKIIESAKTFSQLKIKENFHIEQLNPELNKQVEHLNLSLHFQCINFSLVVTSLLFFSNFYWLVSLNKFAFYVNLN